MAGSTTGHGYTRLGTSRQSGFIFRSSGDVGQAFLVANECSLAPGGELFITKCHSSGHRGPDDERHPERQAHHPEPSQGTEGNGEVKGQLETPTKLQTHPLGYSLRKQEGKTLAVKTADG